MLADFNIISDSLNYSKILEFIFKYILNTTQLSTNQNELLLSLFIINIILKFDPENYSHIRPYGIHEILKLLLERYNLESGCTNLLIWVCITINTVFSSNINVKM